MRFRFGSRLENFDPWVVEGGSVMIESWGFNGDDGGVLVLG